MSNSIFFHIKPMVMPSIKEKIVFLHIPKCAGNSVISSIKRSYGVWKKFFGKGFFDIHHSASLKAADFCSETLHAFRQNILLYGLNHPDVYFIKGHVTVNSSILATYNEQWRFITLLRDPVERWLSEYFYNRYKKENHTKITTAIEDFVETPLAKQYGHRYVTYFTGRELINEEHVEEARRNMELFHLIGLLEDLPEFQRRFQQQFGPGLHIPRKNTNPVSLQEREAIPEAVHKKVKELCKPDIRIYQAAKKQLDQRDMRSDW